ncbi:MAG: ADP-glyceromanno-heptose 6-epimerase [Pseudomonadota bacterium]|nr:ADP-glyceromanno-heptose 6-epimerase [Pseudomonadota bacterium]
MILVTGGAGFIGSNLINQLTNVRKEEIVSVDWHNEKNKEYFLSTKFEVLDPKNLKKFLKKNQKIIKIIIHLGAITSTTERNLDIIIENNIKLSYFLWEWCVKKRKRFIYASSAATYGNGDLGFIDNSQDNYLSKLIPLNLYGWSKHIIDRFIWKKKKELLYPTQCVGLKFFNVYGPNEFHKDDMKSIVLKIYEKIQKNQTIKLFKSHNLNYKDGEQLRDFVYVKDVVAIIEWFLKNPKINGLFNVGSSKPKSFNNLADIVYRNCNKQKKIKYIDTPKNIRKQYQYYTKAELKKLRKEGYKKEFFSLEDGIKDYIRNYLNKL